MSALPIIGAGVMGLVLATELVARGHAPRIFDRAPAPGPHACAWWAGGMLAPWCEAATADAQVLHLGREAITWWSRHTDAVRHHGTLVVSPARDQAELETFARRASSWQALGAEDVAALEPALAGRFAKGLHFPDEAHLSPRAALADLVAGLARRGIGIETSPPPEAALSLDCRGLAAREHLPDLRGVRGEMLVLRCPEITLTRPVRLLHPRIPLYVVPRGDGVFMLGATMIESDLARGPSVRSVSELLAAAFTLHPAFGEAEILEIGHGIRPAFPDNLPHLRPSPGRLHANGLHRHGFLLSPALARMAADHLETGVIPPLMEAAP